MERSLARDPKEAQALILGGTVFVDGQRIDKAGTLLDSHSDIQIVSRQGKYVSRGGLKLEAALRFFGVPVSHKVCLDLGASTGGFTDCLLRHGARKVYAFDVGHGQLDWKLRQDVRVVVKEGVNVRYLDISMVSESVDLITIDLSFISLRLVLPRLAHFPDAQTIALVKPQFEARREEVGPGGIIRSTELQREIVKGVIDFAEEKGFTVLGEVPSPIEGQKGNQEYFIHLSLSEPQPGSFR